MSTRAPVPISLVTGLPGSGKSRAIARLLAFRPDGARWAVLSHDAAGAVAATTTGAIGREAAVGCPCCMGVLPLRTALVEMLRRVRPDRLLIEAHGSAHTAGILDLLREPGLAAAIDLRATLCVADDLCPASPVGRAQIGSADLIVWTGPAPAPHDTLPLNALDLAHADRPAATRADPLGLRRFALPSQKTI